MPEEPDFTKVMPIGNRRGTAIEHLSPGYWNWFLAQPEAAEYPVLVTFGEAHRTSAPEPEPEDNEPLHMQPPVTPTEPDE